MAHPDRLTSPRHRFWSALLVAGLVCASPWLAAAEEDLSRDEAKQKLNQTEQELQSSRAKAEGLSKDLAALAEERAKLNNELIDAGKSVQASEAKLSETEAKLAEFTEQVNVIQNSITERKEAIVKMLSAMQRIGRTPPPALVTRRDDALAVVRSAMLLANIFPELKYQADNLSRELEGLVTVENGIRDQRDKEKSEAERLAAEQASLDRLLEEKKRAAAQGEAELADIKRSTTEQAQTVTDLNELIDRLDTQIAKVEIAQYDAELAAERALLAREQQQALATPANESVVEIKPGTKVAFASPDRLKPALPFEAAKGSLRLPAQGRTGEAVRRPRCRRRHAQGNLAANPRRSPDYRPGRRLGGLCRRIPLLWAAIDHQCRRGLSYPACGDEPHRRKPGPVCPCRRADRGDGQLGSGESRRR